MTHTALGSMGSPTFKPRISPTVLLLERKIRKLGSWGVVWQDSCLVYFLIKSVSTIGRFPSHQIELEGMWPDWYPADYLSRLRTTYLNNTSPEDYQYQEQGWVLRIGGADNRPMRFPVSMTYAGTNETLDIQDHKLVFQLADVLNQMNAEVDSIFQVNFIPWIQSNSA
jgi:hypothetical protein